MPFKSKAQQRWMFAKHPKMAERWAEHTPDIKKLPERKHKSHDEKKAEFIDAFVSSFYSHCTMTKEAIVKSPLFDALLELANTDLVKTAEGMPEGYEAAPTPESGVWARVPPGSTIAVPGGPDGAGHGGSGGAGHGGSGGGGSGRSVGNALGDILLASGPPFVAGALGGAGLARLMSPSQHDIKNLQKEEMIVQYDNAIRELQRRISTRR